MLCALSLIASTGLITPPTLPRCSRRSALGLSAGLAVVPSAATAAPFEWTLLWGGGSPEAAAPKQLRLPATEVAAQLERDLAKNKYILTGQLTPSIFADDCRFVDPNNAVDGLSRYQKALSLLFRPELSELSAVRVSVAGDKRIVADYVAEGVLKLPWRPRIAPWSGHIEWTLNAEGLVASQVDVWNITRLDAIRQTFTPGE